MLATLANLTARRVAKGRIHDSREPAKSDWERRSLISGLKPQRTEYPCRDENEDFEKQTGKVCQSRKGSLTDSMGITGKHANWCNVSRLRPALRTRR